MTCGFEHASHRELEGLTLWKTKDGWQANAQFKAYKGWICATRPTIEEAVRAVLTVLPPRSEPEEGVFG